MLSKMFPETKNAGVFLDKRNKTSGITWNLPGSCFTSNSNWEKYMESRTKRKLNLSKLVVVNLLTIYGCFRDVLNIYLTFLTTHTNPVVWNSVNQYLVSAFVKHRFKKKLVPHAVW